MNIVTGTYDFNLDGMNYEFRQIEKKILDEILGKMVYDSRIRFTIVVIIGRSHHDHHHHGLPAYSHHDKIPPWWEYVSNDKGGNVSVTKSHHT